MQDHETAMADSVAQHESNLATLFAAANGDATAPDLDALGVDVENVEESAQEAIDAYPLSVETATVLTVMLAVGGPTQYMSATVERGDHSWERVSSVQYVDSWAVPSETVLVDGSSLVNLFDQYVETLGD